MEQTRPEPIGTVTPAIEICGLTKSYGRTKALAGVDMRLQRGQWAVLLGENGAGKSTLIQLLCGLFTPDAGSIAVDGIDLTRTPTQALARMGVVFQQPTLDLDLSVQTNLEYHAGLHGMSQAIARQRIQRGLSWMGLADAQRSKVRQLSGGNRRKVELVRALMHSPRVLLMDEATVGLDPPSRQQLLDAVLQLVKEQGLCVLWTTHWAQEVARCDRLLVLRKGQMIFDQTPAALLAQTRCDDVESAFLLLNQRGA
jgi:ABC-2 type transport system ATP-binding protein